MNYLKKITSVAAVALFSLQVSAQTAVEYMEKISAESRKIQSDMWDYTNAVSHGKSARKVEKKRAEVIQTSQQALNRVKNMKPFEDSTTYRDSVTSFLQINLLVLKEDYAKIVDMEEIAEKSYDNMEAYLMAQQGANDKMESSGEMVQKQQAVFAAKHDITLLEADNDRLSENMKIAGEVYEYYNKVYLIFFKSYVQETYLMAALNAQDVNGIQQNKNALAATAKEGLAPLNDIKAFKGTDNSIVLACREMLEFYADEAEKMEIVTDYFLKTENFNTVKASFEQIKAKNRKQEDIDRYNNAVNEMNEAVEAYNANNEVMNDRREDKLDAWNKSVAKFTSKHVPKR